MDHIWSGVEGLVFGQRRIVKRPDRIVELARKTDCATWIVKLEGWIGKLAGRIVKLLREVVKLVL